MESTKSPVSSQASTKVSRYTITYMYIYLHTLHSSWSEYCPHMLLYAVTVRVVVENGGSAAVGGLTTKQPPRPSHRRDDA